MRFLSRSAIGARVPAYPSARISQNVRPPILTCELVLRRTDFYGPRTEHIHMRAVGVLPLNRGIGSAEKSRFTCPTPTMDRAPGSRA